MLVFGRNVLSHKLPIIPDFSLIKQKTQKFKPELCLNIKENIIKTNRVSFSGSDVVPILVRQCCSVCEKGWEDKNIC